MALKTIKSFKKSFTGFYKIMFGLVFIVASTSTETIEVVNVVVFLIGLGTLVWGVADHNYTNYRKG